MAFAYVASILDVTEDGTTSITTGTIDTTGADFILVVVQYRELFGGTLNTPSDSKSNTWNNIATYVSGNAKFQAFYTIPTSTGASHTFTGTHTVYGSPMAIAVVAVSGVNQSTPISDKSGLVSAAYPNDTHQAGSVTPAGTDLFIGVTHADPASGVDCTGIAIDSSFTERAEILQTGGAHLASQASTKESSGAENPTWTYSPAGFWPNGYSFLMALAAPAVAATYLGEDLAHTPQHQSLMAM